ncbi:ribosome-associated protein YbcJ [Deltaproteobacteria bacterium TL4]
MTEFLLEDQPYVALHNLLKHEGYCESGASAKQAVASGQVLVDGQIELRKRCKIKAGQVVEFAGQSIKVRN